MEGGDADSISETTFNNGQIAGNRIAFFVWVKDFFCGRDRDVADEQAALLNLEMLFGEENTEALHGGFLETFVGIFRRQGNNNENAQVNTTPWFRRMWGGRCAADVETGVAPAVADPVTADPVTADPSAAVHAAAITATGAWAGFVKDAQECIKWIITEVFLFVPAKYYIVDGKTGFPTVSELQLCLPDFFLPSIVLHAGCMLGAKCFRNLNIRMGFEGVGLGFGAAATVEAMIFVGFGAPTYAAVAFGFFVFVLLEAKTYDYLH